MKRTQMTPRKRKCRVCREWYMPRNSLQRVCSPECAIVYARNQAKKSQRQKDRRTREQLKTRRDWTKEAQVAFNRWVRLRDYRLPCISCGRSPDDSDLMTGSRWDAGHYRSVGSCPELRFEPINCAKQCVKCNRDLSGNVVEYRIRLRERIGDDALTWLEGPHEPKRYTIDELKDIKRHYNKLASELEKSIERTR